MQVGNKKKDNRQATAFLLTILIFATAADFAAAMLCADFVEFKF